MLIQMHPNFKADTRLSVKKWSLVGSLLSFFIKEQSFAKKKLKCSAVYLKSIGYKIVFMK